MTAKFTNIETQEEFPLEPITQIGRSPASNIVLDDPSVSRRHAMVRLQDGVFWFYDLGSYNGSSINGSHVTGGRELTHGDTIEISKFLFAFRTDNPTEATTMAPPDAQTIAHFRTSPAIILVSDIQGFTRLSEKFPPEVVAQMIGSWYAECEQIISSCSGVVDKFIGDAVLAYWLSDRPDTKANALRAATSLQAACRKISVDLEATTGGHEMRSGVALHTGEVAHGGMGGGERTLIGDAVNVAFRLEALTRDIDALVVTSSDFLDGWTDGHQYCRSLGLQNLKGKARPVEVFAVDSAPV